MALTTEYAQEYQQAVSAYMNCRYDEARDITDRLAIGYPEEPNLMLLRGHIAACLQDLDAAKTHYKSVLTLTADTELLDCANNSLLGIAQQQGSSESDSPWGAEQPSAPALSDWDSDGVTALQNDEQNGVESPESSMGQPLEAQALNLETDHNVMNLSELELETNGVVEDLDPFSVPEGGNAFEIDGDPFASNFFDVSGELAEVNPVANPEVNSEVNLEVNSAINAEVASEEWAESLESLDSLDSTGADDNLADLTADNLADLTADLTAGLPADFSSDLSADLSSGLWDLSSGATADESQPYEPLPTYQIDLSELDESLERAKAIDSPSPMAQEQAEQFGNEQLGDMPVSDVQLGESGGDFAVLSLPVVETEESRAAAEIGELNFAEPDLGTPFDAFTSEQASAEFALDSYEPEAEFSSEAEFQLPLRDEQPQAEQGLPADLPLSTEDESSLWGSELSGDLNWANAGLDHRLMEEQAGLPQPEPSLDLDQDHSLFDLVGADERPSAGQQPSLISDVDDHGEDSLFGDYFDIPLPSVVEGVTDDSGVVDISYGITEENLPSGELGTLSLPDLEADNNYSGSLSDWPYPASNSSGKTETFGLNSTSYEFDDGNLDDMSDATADLRMESGVGMPDLPRLDTADLGAHLWENASEQFSFVNGSNSNSEVTAQPNNFGAVAMPSAGADATLRPSPGKANASLDKQNRNHALMAGAASALVGGVVALLGGTPQALPAAALAGLAGGTTTFINGQRQVKRIRRATTDLQNQFSALVEGDFSAKATEFEEDEFGQLANGFNQMTRVVSSVTLEARRKAEENEKSREDLQRQVIRLLDDVEGAARGDLTVQAEVSADVLGAVADSFNLTIHNLRKIVQQVKVAAVQVNKGATENESFARTLSADALRQAEELAVTLNSVQMMTNAIQRVADSAKEANEVARIASDTALKGGEAVERTVFGILQIRETVAETTRKVKRLAESSQEISKIVNVIAQIASRTNLLALNASIEAARAGESGRGFAIVADEVRQLADRAAKASKEIEGIVLQIQSETGSVMTAMEEGTQQVIQGTKLAEQAKGALEDIIQVSSQIDRLVRSITNATVEQTETARSMAQVMQSVELTAQATSQEAQRVSNSLHQLATVSGDLQSSVEKFKVEENQPL
jgi:twitching motility protein PilJ